MSKAPCACKRHDLGYTGDKGEQRAWWSLHTDGGEHSLEMCSFAAADGGVTYHLRAPRAVAAIIATLTGYSKSRA